MGNAVKSIGNAIGGAATGFLGSGGSPIGAVAGLIGGLTQKKSSGSTNPAELYAQAPSTMTEAQKIAGTNMLDLATGFMTNPTRTPTFTKSYSPVNRPTLPTATKLFGGASGAQTPDRSGEIQAAASPIASRLTAPTMLQSLPSADAAAAAVGAPLQTGAASGYSNPLDAAAGERAMSNLNRAPLTAGYDQKMLEDLASQKFDPLARAFDQSFAAVQQKMNRNRLGGSGFEDRALVYDPDSVTNQFARASSDASRDLRIAAGEAERSDRYRNIDVGNQDLSAAMSVSGQQSDEQFRRNQADLSRELQERGLTQQAFEMARQAGLDENQVIALNNDLQRTSGLDQQNLDLANKDLMMKGLQTNLQQDQTNEANRQFYMNRDDSAQQYDNAQAMARWLQENGIAETETARREEVDSFNQSEQVRGFDAEQERQRQAMQNFAAVLSGQAPIQQANQQNWNNAQNIAAQNAQAKSQQQADQMNGIMQLLAGFGGASKQNPVAPTSYSYTPSAYDMSKYLGGSTSNKPVTFKF